jgi:hypothetical protein
MISRNRLVIISAIMGAALICGILHYFVKKLMIVDRLMAFLQQFPLDMKVISMGVTLCQTVAQYKTINLRWTPEVKQVLAATSITNLNIQIVGFPRTIFLLCQSNDSRASFIMICLPSSFSCCFTVYSGES